MMGKSFDFEDYYVVESQEPPTGNNNNSGGGGTASGDHKKGDDDGEENNPIWDRVPPIARIFGQVYHTNASSSGITLVVIVST